MNRIIGELYLTGIVIFLLCGCEQSEISTPTTPNSFEFYPTENAVWITKAYLQSPVGTFTFIDTIRFGADTILESRTLFPYSSFWSDSEPPSAKLFHTLVATTMTISPESDTTYSGPYRYGQFTQVAEDKELYVLRTDNSDENHYDDLELQLGKEVGDTMVVTHYFNTVYFVMDIDSIPFGNMYLRKVWYGTVGANEPSGTVTQAVDLQRIGSSLPHPTGNIQWKKFIYESDTLVIQ